MKPHVVQVIMEEPLIVGSPPKIGMSVTNHTDVSKAVLMLVRAIIGLASGTVISQPQTPSSDTTEGGVK